MSNKELIAEARRIPWYEDPITEARRDSWYVQSEYRYELVNRLADALEAVERERDEAQAKLADLKGHHATLQRWLNEAVADNAALFRRAQHDDSCNCYMGWKDLECNCSLKTAHPGAALLARVERLEAVADAAGRLCVLQGIGPYFAPLIGTLDALSESEAAQE